LLLLTPKNGTGKGLTSGPSLVMKYHSARKDLLRGFGKGRLWSAMRHHSAKGLFVHLREVFRNAWWRNLIWGRNELMAYTRWTLASKR
jgi:hypothetical protein